MMFGSVLVANRGEIAVRIMRTLAALGVRSVAVYTGADSEALHVKRADTAVRIGSYLDIEEIVAAALATGSEAIHPGYGFLSENAAFARRAASEGLTFVGPPAEAIELMGDKINAKQAVSAAGVPVVPGSDEPGMSDEALASAARSVGFPVLLKPSAGGGGKGMRRVDDPALLMGEIAAARREAQGAFGDPTLLVERFVPVPRHIEVQVFGDNHGQVVALGERECSLQRRHQKIIEESPSPLLDDGTRSAIAESAVAAAKACGYVGAGTVEFIAAGDSAGDYFFMEMNTRLQVEHPVTEMVTGWDLVEWQLRVAAGEPLPPEMARRSPRGHAIEARLYAENPERGFLPSSGTVLLVDEPASLDNVRVDSALQAGMVVGTGYDPMLAKVIAWGDDRPAALRRLHQALEATCVLGLTTNTGFLRRLLQHPDVVAGRLDTELVERCSSSLAGRRLPDSAAAAGAVLTLMRAAPASKAPGPWDLAGAWRVGGPAESVVGFRVAGSTVEVGLRSRVGAHAGAGRFEGTVWVGDSAPAPLNARLDGPGSVVVEVAGSSRRYRWAVEGATLWVGAGGDAWAMQQQPGAIGAAGPAAGGAGPVTSPMPGTVIAVHVAAGDAVTAGQPLVSVEAMKMEHSVNSPIDGTVTGLLVRPGDNVTLDQPLAVVSSQENEDANE